MEVGIDGDIRPVILCVIEVCRTGPHGEVEFSVAGSKCNSVFADPESVEAENASLEIIAEVFETLPKKIASLFVSARNPIEENSWLNFGLALRDIQKHAPLKLYFQNVVKVWNGWLLQRPEHVALGSAQRIQPAREINDWIQALTR